MSNNFWNKLREAVTGASKPMVKQASAVAADGRIPMKEAEASGLMKRAKAMGWGLYQVEELDGGLGSIWHVEKDAATGEQFLVKNVDPIGDIVRRVKTASVMSKTAAIDDENIIPDGKDDGFGEQDNLIVDEYPETQSTATPAPMSDMVQSYLVTALWAETDNSDPNTGGDPLDKNYTIYDFAPDAVAKATADCAEFERRAGSLLEGIERQGQDVPDVIGFHFWLTRNHHGAGFWDGDYPKEIGEALTKISHEFGEENAYVGDDGKLHLS
jgi:hypothetical protein